MFTSVLCISCISVVYTVNSVNKIDNVCKVYSQRGTHLANIRVPTQVKNKLDEIGRYLAEKECKKDVPYGEIVFFLIEQFEQHKENKSGNRYAKKELINQ